MTETEALDSARLIVRSGRWWLDLADADIERAARSIIRDISYRGELLEDGLRYAGERHDSQLRYDLLNAVYAIGVFTGECKDVVQ